MLNELVLAHEVGSHWGNGEGPEDDSFGHEHAGHTCHYACEAPVHEGGVFDVEVVFSFSNVSPVSFLLGGVEIGVEIQDVLPEELHPQTVSLLLLFVEASLVLEVFLFSDISAHRFRHFNNLIFKLIITPFHSKIFPSIRLTSFPPNESYFSLSYL